jgi:hypothetical protein
MILFRYYSDDKLSEPWRRRFGEMHGNCINSASAVLCIPADLVENSLKYEYERVRDLSLVKTS